MADSPDTPVPGDERGPESPRPGELVVREADVAPVPRRRPGVVDVLRARLPELARHPAVVATATVGAGLLMQAAREALRPPAARHDRARAPVQVTGYVVHHVHVVHSFAPVVFDPLARLAIPPPSEIDSR